MNRKTLLICILSLGLLLRFLFIPNPGFEADVAFWKGWGLAAADKGVVWSMQNTNNNYPTPFAYTLGGMVHLYRLLGGNPHNFDDYWSNTNLRFLFVSKLPAILADIGIFCVILWIGKKRSRFNLPGSANLYAGMAILYFLNPIAIMDGSWWGQVDSLGVVYFLLAVVTLLYKKPFLAGVIFMFAMMTKLQNMIYGPLFFAFIWAEFGLIHLIQSIAGSGLAFFGLNIEFFLNKNMNRVISSLIDNYDYFPYMSLHAYNPWWIVAGGRGMQMSDKFLSIGIMTAKSIGTIGFAASYLIAILQIAASSLKNIFLPYKKSAHPLFQSSMRYFYLFLGLTIVNLGFFLFQTQSHERYAFPVIAFSLFLLPFLSKTKQHIFIIGYILFSTLYFLNLHTAFAANYPDNVFQFLRFLDAPTPTIIMSILQTAAFFLLIGFFAKKISYPILGIGIAFFIAMIINGNLSYIQNKPMLLSKLKPISSSQGYGSRQKDMPANASFGPKSWAFLSTQYAFYRHGIGTHANSDITYDIGGRFSEIQTDYGIDTTAGSQSSAIFEIWGDGKKLFTSNKVGRFDMPQHIRIPITGITRLTLRTLDAGDSNRDDHTNWLNTKLVP